MSSYCIVYKSFHDLYMLRNDLHDDKLHPYLLIIVTFLRQSVTGEKVTPSHLSLGNL